MIVITDKAHKRDVGLLAVFAGCLSIFDMSEAIESDNAARMVTFGMCAVVMVLACVRNLIRYFNAEVEQ